MKANEKLTCAEGKQGKWESFVAKNQDPYDHQCILATAQVGKALDDGKPCKEAHDAMYGLDLTGFMAGCVAGMISAFHPRGDEFRRWWNRDCQIGTEGEEANKKGGVLNPAILTMK